MKPSPSFVVLLCHLWLRNPTRPWSKKFPCWLKRCIAIEKYRSVPCKRLPLSHPITRAVSSCHYLRHFSFLVSLRTRTIAFVCYSQSKHCQQRRQTLLARKRSRVINYAAPNRPTRPPVVQRQYQWMQVYVPTISNCGVPSRRTKNVDCYRSSAWSVTNQSKYIGVQMSFLW